MEPYQVSLVIGLAMCVVEMVTTTFVFLSFGFALFIVALLQYLTGEFNTNRDIATFAVLSLMLTIVFRKIFKFKNDSEKIHPESDINKY